MCLSLTDTFNFFWIKTSPPGGKSQSHKIQEANQNLPDRGSSESHNLGYSLQVLGRRKWFSLCNFVVTLGQECWCLLRLCSDGDWLALGLTCELCTLTHCGTEGRWLAQGSVPGSYFQHPFHWLHSGKQEEEPEGLYKQRHGTLANNGLWGPKTSRSHSWEMAVLKFEVNYVAAD